MLTKDKELFWFSSQVPDNVFANSERARSLALGFLELSDSTLSVSSGYASKYNHAFKLEGGKRKRGFSNPNKDTRVSLSLVCNSADRIPEHG